MPTPSPTPPPRSPRPLRSASSRASAPAGTGLRHLVVVLGDQLDRGASAFDGFDPARDRVLMCEAREEATQVWSSKPRIALFLAAMRHFAATLRDEGLPLDYRQGHDGVSNATLAGALDGVAVEGLVVTEPGEWRVREAIAMAAARHGVPVDWRPDRHFLCTPEQFAAHAHGRRELRMEYFYREMRHRHGVLMDGPKQDQPAGGAWNYDAENRRGFGAEGPGLVPPPLGFPPDAITRGVIADVESRYADHPGQLASFAWPVTPAQARAALDDFLRHRLPEFGRYQDAMWHGQPWLYHARISAALNLKLLDPREAIAGAEAAWRAGRAPLPAVEGFIRQILGWREYVRGIYGLHMPGYAARNALDAHEPLPPWYWTGATDLACLADAIGQTLEHGYAHHIQRLMVTGLYALLLGVEPDEVHRWYLAVYVDAVEWVELPNTLGMSQYADGGVMASKPYAATGQYIARMSDHCRGCRYDPAQRTGERACPFTTLYWDFLARHRDRFARNPRMALQLRNLERLPAVELAAIRDAAAAIVRANRATAARDAPSYTTTPFDPAQNNPKPSSNAADIVT